MNDIIAQCARAHSEATAAHQEALDRQSAIAKRIADIAAQKNAITAARLEGEATKEQAAEYAALQGDHESLTEMLKDAQCAVEQTVEPLTQARDALSRAQTEHAKAQAVIAFEALSQKTTQIEAMLTKAIAATHKAGRAIGHFQLSQSWKPSEPLYRACHLGVCPPERA